MHTTHYTPTQMVEKEWIFQNECWTLNIEHCDSVTINYKTFNIKHLSIYTLHGLNGLYRTAIQWIEMIIIIIMGATHGWAANLQIYRFYRCYSSLNVLLVDLFVFIEFVLPAQNLYKTITMFKIHVMMWTVNDEYIFIINNGIHFIVLKPSLTW